MVLVAEFEFEYLLRTSCRQCIGISSSSHRMTRLLPSRGPCFEAALNKFHIVTFHKVDQLLP